MRYLHLVIAIFIFTLISCHKEDDFKSYGLEGDYVIFGGVYGECLNDCRTLFVVTDKGLWADDDQLVPLDSTIFKTEQLGDSKFQLANTLLDVPLEIELNHINEAHLLRPIADFDYYIKGRINGHTFFMTFSDIDDAADEDLKTYTDRMITIFNEVVQL